MPLNSPKIATTAKIHEIIVLVIFFITLGWLCYLKIILSYQAGQYGRLDTLNTKICQLFQILDIEVILAP